MFTNYFAMSKKRKFYSIFMTNKKCVKIMKKRKEKKKVNFFFCGSSEKTRKNIHILYFEINCIIPYFESEGITFEIQILTSH